MGHDTATSERDKNQTNPCEPLSVLVPVDTARDMLDAKKVCILSFKKRKQVLQCKLFATLPKSLDSTEMPDKPYNNLTGVCMREAKKTNPCEPLAVFAQAATAFDMLDPDFKMLGTGQAVTSSKAENAYLLFQWKKHLTARAALRVLQPHPDPWNDAGSQLGRSPRAAICPHCPQCARPQLQDAQDGTGRVDLRVIQPSVVRTKDSHS